MDDFSRVEAAEAVPAPVSWPDLEAILEGRRLALFVDYDGTLTPIAERPDLAHLSDDTRTLLARLAEHMPVTVITGRDLADVKARVGLDQLIYVGSHGFAVDGPGISGQPEAASEDARALVDRIGAELQARLADVPNVIVETKRFSAAVHYRLVPEDRIGAILDIVDDIGAREPALRVSGGKKLVELRPDVDWHKGTALFWVLRALDLDRGDVLPLFLGDDVTDEDAFRSLKAAGKGYGIVVCDPPRPSHAHGRVADPEAVAQLLAQCLTWATRHA